VSKLYLTVSQTENTIPYVFPMTDVRVYSLEEALYHCLHHWQHSTGDFLSDPFIKWVEGTLGLEKIGTALREANRFESFSERFLFFLNVVDYLPKDGLRALQKELEQWEKRQMWEKLAEQGDFWLARGEGERAYVFYGRALGYHENAKLLNNSGVALMHMGSYDEAAAFFVKALQMDVANQQLYFNLIEAYILAGDYESAQSLIEEITAKYPEHPEIFYFQAEINFYNKNYFEAVKLYEKAARLDYDPQYIYKLCDCYMKMRLYDKALAAVQDVAVHDVAFLRRQAGYYVEAGNVPMAIRCIEKALTDYPNDPKLWTTLAAYHRMDYNLPKAAEFIARALALLPDNAAAMLEQARIRKMQGYTREYQGILSRILLKFKRDYREIMQK